ncbi:MAG: formate/nitrite transporter family protein [Alphaproteobacteria bacterium]|nr:formate/nitrite transporter family protein [Alphaproteobacteria bacterium]
MADEVKLAEPNSIDAYAPRQIAERVENAGVAKAGLATVPTLVLGVLAGAFIAFGAMLYVVVVTNSGLGFGPERLLGGVAFSLGLILVLVGGAELFTGNSLIIFALADGKISLKSLLRNWGLVYLGNFLGATAIALMVHWSGIHNLADGAVGATVMRIAEGKLALAPLEAFIRGILCNVLVCLAVWLCFAARSVSGKILAIVFPISGFVALGFEHSVANMYIIPAGSLAGSELVTMAGYAANLLIVTIGNVIGGGLLVALVYWLIYRKDWGPSNGLS